MTRKRLTVVSDKVWKGGFSQMRYVAELFVAESLQLRKSSRTLLQQETGHGSAAALGPNSLHHQSMAFAYIKQRLDDFCFPADATPVEQMLELCCCQMDENAVVGMNGFQQYICQSALPKGK